jgi:hypothetical protein
LTDEYAMNNPVTVVGPRSSPRTGMAWRFRLAKKERGHRGLLMEGRAAREGSAEEVEFFLLIGSDFGTADVHSLRGESFALIEYFAGFLGQPERGPHPINIGELMDSEDEIPVNAYWRIREDHRAEIVEGLLKVLEGQEIRDG